MIRRILPKLLAVIAISWYSEKKAFSQEIEAAESRRTVVGEALESLSIHRLVEQSLEVNPGLQRMAAQIDSVRGRALQAGLPPNPMMMVNGEELGGGMASGGVQTLPLLSQEIVTAGKLRLSRATLNCEVDQATLNWIAARYAQMALVRRGYFEVLAAQRRVEILAHLEAVADRSLATALGLQAALEIAELDVIQFRVERNRYRAETQAAREEWQAAFRRFTAEAGISHLEFGPLENLFELPDPEYDYESAKQIIAESHPQLQAAQLGVSRAQWALRRAGAEPIPNITVAAGYQRNHKDIADEWMFQASMPLPLFNRNQGNRRAATAELSAAASQVEATMYELLARLATNMGEFDAAKRRVNEYRSAIIPEAERALELATTAFQGGEFQYLRVLQAQRTLGEAQLELNRALSAMWQAAANLSGLLLEERWPQ